MLKFRPKYINDEVNSLDPYFQGKVMIQCWPPVASTESRLIVQDVDSEIEYDAEEYQDWLYYHNYIMRSWATYIPPVKDLDRVPGYDRCFDCTNEAVSWVEYLSKNGVPFKFRNRTVSDLMNQLTYLTKQKLLTDKGKSVHGKIRELCMHDRYNLL
jgi:hypothetical protein